MISERRDKRLKDLSRRRQHDLTVILENVHDPHNIGAVMRTCDAVGISDIHVIYTEEGANSIKEYIGNKASKGTKKWVRGHFYHSIEECLKVVQPNFDQLLATHLTSESKSVFETDLCKSTALVFGNEREGISTDLLGECSGNILIPMVGMVQSLNISVAAAVCLYEAFKQRLDRGLYNREFDSNNKYMQELYDEGVEITYPRIAETNKEVLKNISPTK